MKALPALALLFACSCASAAPLDCNAFAETAAADVAARNDHVPLADMIDTIRAGAPDETVSLQIAQVRDIYTNPYYKGVSAERVARLAYSVCMQNGGRP